MVAALAKTVLGTLVLTACADKVQTPFLHHARGSEVNEEQLLSQEHVQRLDASTEPQPPAGLLSQSLNAATNGTTTMHDILQEIADVIGEQLHVKEGQLINAVAAFVVGLLILIDGNMIFKTLLLLAVFAVSGTFAATEVSIAWSLHGGWKNDLVVCVGLEVGAIMAYVAYKGIDGIMTGIAVFFGLFVASGIQQTVALQESGLNGNHHVVLYLYSAAVLASMVVVRRGRMLAIISSAFGGLLVASSICFLYTFAATKGQLGALKQVVPDLKPARLGAWVDFVSMLCGYTSKDYGVLTGHYFYGMEADRVLGRVVWAVIAELGIITQVQRLQRTKSTVVAAREVQDALRVPLL